MPFTGSHPAAVLPFLGTPLPISALVAGSMAPDSAYYVPGLAFGFDPETHQFSGVLGINLYLGLLMWAVWHLVLAGPAVAAAPAAVRARVGHVPIGLRTRLRRPVDLLLVPAAVIVGATSHVALDNLTHPWGWAVPHSAWLRSEHLDVPGWTWAQVVGSVVGLVAIGLTVIVAWRRAPITPVPAARAEVPISVLVVWGLIVGAAVLGALRGLYVVDVRGIPLEMVPWNVLTRSFGLAATVAVGLALLWHLLRIPRALGHTALRSAPK